MGRLSQDQRWHGLRCELRFDGLVPVMCEEEEEEEEEE